MIDVGTSGHGSDGGVFANSQFDAAMHNNHLHMPTFKRLPGVTYSLPYVLVADNAFPLRTNLMKPYAGKNRPYRESVFNYQLARTCSKPNSETGNMTSHK